MTRWLRRHPLVRDALIWAIPAVIFGGVLRLMLLHYNPYAYFGSDSKSYYGFAHDLVTSFEFSLDDKRRYVYPIFLLPVTLLPGSPLKWIAWIQHGIGLITLIPLAYCVRKTMRGWRAWIVPVTAFYAGMPMILWYEHELLADNLFFAGILWSMAGWIAWTSEPNPLRARRLWWLFFVPFAMVLLTKPSGRFLLPGIVIGLLVTAAWRVLDWKRIAACAGVILLSLTVGQESQGAWLLYTSAFPLTRLETPLHAEYKREVHDFVLHMREKIDAYPYFEAEPFQFLDKPRNHPETPLFQALDQDSRLKTKVYRDLAMEGIKARPDLFLYISLQRVISSLNPAEFGVNRFAPGFFPEKFEHLYDDFANRKPSMIHLLFALPKTAPLPDYASVSRLLSPAPESMAARVLPSYAEEFENGAALLQATEKLARPDRTISQRRPTPLGAWMLAGAALTLIIPSLRNRLGVWTIVIVGYLLGVFLVGGENARYFGAAWPVLTLWLAVPAEALLLLGLTFPRKT